MIMWVVICSAGITQTFTEKYHLHVHAQKIRLNSLPVSVGFLLGLTLSPRKT
jgi:hypothetical protein